MKKMESFGQFVKRKIIDLGSGIYRSIVYPFVRMYIERSTDSIMCKGSYLRGGSTLEGRDYISNNVLLDNVHVGYSSYVGRDSCVSNTVIGKYSCIGSVQTYIGNHPVKGENISIHPSFYSTAKQYGYTNVTENSYVENVWVDEEKHIQISIGNDVWIGCGTSICQGVTIGDGAVVGACSLVTKDIEPYSIYAGIPAKKIGERFDSDTVQKLLELKWWDKEDAWIKEHAKHFASPNTFWDNMLK